MTACCPTCGREWSAAQRVEREAALLRDWIAREGVRLVAGRISEPDAARYLGRSERTLRQWRDTERPLPFTRIGGRALYGIEDVAIFLVDCARW